MKITEKERYISLRIFDRTKIEIFSLFAWPWECNGSKRWYATIFFFFLLLSHQLLYFHLKVKNSDRAETVILTPTIIVAIELPFLFFLLTSYRMTLCENTILGLVIYITIPNNQNSWVYGVLWLQIVVSLLFAKQIDFLHSKRFDQKGHISW